MGIRGYQKYIMKIATDPLYSWASSDHKMVALKSDVDAPSGLSLSSSSTHSRTTSSTVTETNTFSFIIPDVFDVFSVIDGTIQGNVKIGAEEDGGDDSLEITKVEIGLRAVQPDGTSRSIVPDTTIWTGSLYVESYTVGASATKQLMYWADVTDGVIRSNEKIIIDFTYTYTITISGAGGDFYTRIYSTPTTEETTITLPFVM